MSPNLKICASSVSGAVTHPLSPQPFTPQFCLAGQKKKNLSHTALKRGQLEAPGYKRGSQHGHCALCVSHADDDLLYGANVTVSGALLAVDKGQFCLGDLRRVRVSCFSVSLHISTELRRVMSHRGATRQLSQSSPGADSVRSLRRKRREKKRSLGQSEPASATSDAASTEWEFFSSRAP